MRLLTVRVAVVHNVSNLPAPIDPKYIALQWWLRRYIEPALYLEKAKKRHAQLLAVRLLNLSA